MSDKYTTIEQRASYGVGRQMGEQLVNQPFDGLDKEAVITGVTEALILLVVILIVQNLVQTVVTTKLTSD